MKLFGLSKGLNSGDVFPFLKGTIGTKGDGFIVFPDFFSSKCVGGPGWFLLSYSQYSKSTETFHKGSSP